MESKKERPVVGLGDEPVTQHESLGSGGWLSNLLPTKHFNLFFSNYLAELSLDTFHYCHSS